MTDVWKVFIPENKLEAYRQLLEEGLIRNAFATYSRKTKTTTIEYDSDKPHEWILSELKRRCENL